MLFVCLIVDVEYFERYDFYYNKFTSLVDSLARNLCNTKFICNFKIK